MDETGRILVDTLGAEWNGMEAYTHIINSNERVREWVYATGVITRVYGVASADRDAPVVQALREGLSASFLSESAARFDVNHDGVISEAEQRVALNVLEEQLKSDRDNVTLSGDVYVGHSRFEPLVISSHTALSLGFLRGAAATGWIVAGFLFFLATFVYPEEAHVLLRAISNAR